ncbi:MAG TPA: YitT family protein [Sphaerochaeta sp.]|nr:YitT family protein [Sphaerochaeta sp.]
MPSRRRFLIAEIFYIIIGSLLTAAGVVLFCSPAKIVSGGVSGIAIIFYHTLGFDIGLTILVLSLPLFFVGVLIFGAQYGIKSLFGTLLLSGFASLLEVLFAAKPLLSYQKEVSILLSAIAGGALMGIGIGLVLRSGANTGGTDILAQIVARYTPLSLGSSLFAVDGLIIAFSALIFGFEMALYAVITVYITGIIIDKTVISVGTRSAKTVYVISDKAYEIAQAVMEELDHGVTRIEAEGMYLAQERGMIMTVVANNKLARLTEIVHRYDTAAFMIVSETHQVLGEGFGSIEAATWRGRSDTTQQL